MTKIWIVELSGELHAFLTRDELRRFCGAPGREVYGVRSCEVLGSLHLLLTRSNDQAMQPVAVLDALRRENVAEVVREVVRDLSRLTGLTHSAIRGSKYLSVVRVRKLGYWVTGRRCEQAWSDLGRAWGKDHSTLMHGYRSFQGDLDRGVAWAVKLRDAWELAVGPSEAVAS